MLAEAQRLRPGAGYSDWRGGNPRTQRDRGDAGGSAPCPSAAFPPRALRHEFDLDAALARRPALILVDELAHSNAPGSRHPKRWQDVEELLEAGIDVFTTVNVQHLESLNDVVSGITGVQVRETVPIPF
jgi:two-component system sensor histidine kinase KdpD